MPAEPERSGDKPADDKAAPAPPLAPALVLAQRASAAALVYVLCGVYCWALWSSSRLLVEGVAAAR